MIIYNSYIQKVKICRQFTTFLIAITLSFAFNACTTQSKDVKTISNDNNFQWPKGKKMGLSLTFDDARFSQADKGIPLLDRYGVKGTFYVIAKNMQHRLEAWKNAAINGHEIGNHSIYHPCSGNFDWSKESALEDYTLLEMYTELDSANNVIKKNIGVYPNSFAFPCGQTFVGRGKNTKSYIPIVSELFETGRGYNNESPNDPSFCDMSHLMGMNLDGKSFDQIKKTIENAKSSGKWLILVGHETNIVGDGISLLSTIDAICNYALDPANGIWIDNVHNIALYVNSKRADSLLYNTHLKRN